MDDQEYTPEEIDQHFIAMGHSVNLINATVADDTEAKRVHDGSQGTKDMMDRNVEHLELQLSKQWCIDDARAKTSYEDAITAGKAYIAAN
jgi:hypothetical protein|tara:strand:- start:44 stop:313 length:270 start_codon:yes stop_codon:yes gene_type:complete